jgi:hypothetical protein
MVNPFRALFCLPIYDGVMPELWYGPIPGRCGEWVSVGDAGIPFSGGKPDVEVVGEAEL